MHTLPVHLKDARGDRMNVLGISGTPKKGGFTDRLLESALNGARSAGAATEKLVLNDLIFKPCQDCGECNATGACVLDDDMKATYDKIARADGIIIASPIFFGNVSGQLKTFIDRLQPLWIAKFILKRPSPKRRKGVFLCVGGMDRTEYFDSARKVVRMAFATTDTEYAGELFFGGYNEKKHDETAKKEALEKAFSLGAAVV